MTSSDSKLEKVRTQFQALTSVANSLNTASDELTANVSALDESLKKLNVGLTVWTAIRTRECEDAEYDQDELGYAKVDGSWGIALRQIWGDESRDQHGQGGPWLFRDAPRELRIVAADYFPKLIEALAKVASNTAVKLQSKARDVGELAASIREIANEPGGQTIAARIATGQQSLNAERIVGVRQLLDRQGK